MENKQSGKGSLSYGILRGLLSSLVITGLSLLIISVIYLAGDFSENLLRTLVTAFALLSVFISSLSGGLSLRRQGLFMGFCIGALYALCLYITGFLSFGFPGFSKGLLGTLALSVLMGSLGGIIGVNIKRKK
jgi:putative membrane protein (TIGR04086 family)